MEDNRKVSFSGQDSGLSAFMQKVRGDSKRMFDEQLKNAKSFTTELKEQFGNLTKFVTLLGRRNKIEEDAHKTRVRNLLEEDRLLMSQAHTGTALWRRLHPRRPVGPPTPPTVEEEEGELGSKGRPAVVTSKPSIFGEILRATVVRDFANLFRQIPSARTGVEAISGVSNAAGAAAGALLGAAFQKSAIGAILGRAGLGFAGDAMTRHIQEQSRFSGTVGRLRGLGADASDLSIDLADLGLDRNAAGALKESIVRAIGFDPREMIRDVAAEMKAFTLDEGTVTSFLGTRRFGATIPSMNMLTRTGLDQGLNKADVNRLLTNQTQLVNLLAQSQVAPNSFGAAKTLLDFNAIGGPFRVSDPRSMDLLSTMHGNLVSPQTPFGQAQSYSVLRRMNRNAGLVDLLIEQQRGIENRGLVSGTLEDIVKMGGGEDFQTLMVAQRLGLGNNLGAARMLLRDRGKIGQMTDEDFTTYSQQELNEMARQNVPRLEQNMAAITNAFIDGMGSGIKTVSEKFAKEISEAGKEGLKELPELIVNSFEEGFKLLGVQSTYSKAQVDSIRRKYSRTPNR